MLTFLSDLTVNEVVTLLTILIGGIVSYTSISNRIANIEARNTLADANMKELKESFHKYFDAKHTLVEARVKEVESELVIQKMFLGRIDERLGFIQTLLEQMNKNKE